MKKEMVLSLTAKQSYMDQEPDVIELVTDGILENTPNGWVITYEESALTGLEGVSTSFLLEGDSVTLTRTGKLNSQMFFQEGVSHESLYEMEFGALMLTVCAALIRWDISFQGGNVDLQYKIEIEQSAAGTVDYHLEIKPKL